MRPVVIVDTFPRRTETFIKDHIEGLNADVFSIYCPASAVDAWRWRSRPYVASVYQHDAPAKTFLRRAAGRARETILGLPPPSWPPEAHRRWDDYVRERAPTVALAEFGPNGICALPACQRTGVPLIVHFHGYDASSLLRSKAYRVRLTTLFAHSHALVAVCEAMRLRLLDLCCPEDKLFLIRCGAPSCSFDGAGVTHQPCRFLGVSAFVPVKGVPITIRAFELCADAIEGVTLTICGDGPLFARCRRQARRSPHAASIHMRGYVSHEEVAWEMRRAGTFVQHSLTSPRLRAVEGSPVAIAEASLSGLPVVATRHGGVPDLVLHEHTGLLVEEGDVDGMARCMIRLASDPALRSRLGGNARQHARRVAHQNTQLCLLRSLLDSVERRGLL